MIERLSLRIAMTAVLLGGCGSERSPAAIEQQAAMERRAASAPTRWVQVREPTDLSLLEAPARVVSTTAVQGEVAPTMTMRVTALHVAPGQAVAVGDPVLDAVVPEALAAAAQWIAAARQLGVHRDRRTTLEGLRSEGIIEESTVFEQTARVAELTAEQASALAMLQAVGVSPSDVGATLRRGSITLRAPVAGVVRDLDVRLGEVRAPGDRPFARIVGLATPRIEVRASHPTPGDGTPTFFGVDGSIVVLAPEISSVLDAADGTYLAWLDPATPSGPLPDGMRGEVHWSWPTGRALEVPARALRMEPGRTIVLRRVGDVGEPVEVRVVAASPTSAIVTGALTVEDFVAADAATVLRAPESDE